MICNYKTITMSLDNSLRKLKFKFTSQKFVIQMIRYIKISCSSNSVIPTHLHRAGITRIQKYHPPVKTVAFFTRNSSLQAGSSKMQQPTLSKAITTSIDIMNLNVAMMTRVLELVWTSYRGDHMLTGSLPEDSYPKSSHVDKQLIIDKHLIALFRRTGTWC